MQELRNITSNFERGNTLRFKHLVSFFMEPRGIHTFVQPALGTAEKDKDGEEVQSRVFRPP